MGVIVQGGKTVIGSRRFGSTTNPLWDDLLVYYKADNTPNDSLGNYNGTLVGGTTYGTGIINNGFSFDGVNDYVTAGSPIHVYSTPTSYNMWVYPNDLISQQFFVYLPSGNYGPGVGILGSSLTFTRGSVNFRATSTATLSLSTWQMVTVVFKGNASYPNNVDFYLNGTYVDTKSMSGVNGVQPTSLNIGGYQYFNGNVDELSIFNRELTPTEVTELYNSGAGLQYPN